MQGRALRAWRKAQGWTLEQAARYLGTTKTSVHRWEVEDHPIPQTIEILAHLLAEKGNIRRVEKYVWKTLD